MALAAATRASTFWTRIGAHTVGSFSICGATLLPVDLLPTIFTSSFAILARLFRWRLVTCFPKAATSSSSAPEYNVGPRFWWYKPDPLKQKRGSPCTMNNTYRTLVFLRRATWRVGSCTRRERRNKISPGLCCFYRRANQIRDHCSQG